MEGNTRDLFNSLNNDGRVPVVPTDLPGEETSKDALNGSNLERRMQSVSTIGNKSIGSLQEPIKQSPAMSVQEKQHHLQQDLAELQQRPVMGAMAVLPSKANFETKDREEQVILVLRPHLITNLRWIIITAVLALVPLLSLPIMPSSIAPRFQILGVLVWELLLFGYALEQFLMWFYNIYIITDERVVDIDFKNLLLREISDADLDKIQDVTISSSGVFAALFHYGHIQIQTAGERQEFEFAAVPQPERVIKVIRDLIEYNELKEGKATGL